MENNGKWCKGKSYHGRLGWGGCGNRASRDGFCGIHHPDAVKRREENSKKRYAQLSAAIDAKWKIDKEKQRKLSSFDDLVAALEELIGDNPHAHLAREGSPIWRAQIALAKVKG